MTTTPIGSATATAPAPQRTARHLTLRLMDVAAEAQTMGAAMNHASLNVANALGAWLGGLVIAAGWGYRAPGVVGAGLAVGGLLVLAIAAALAQRQPPDVAR